MLQTLRDFLPRRHPDLLHIKRNTVVVERLALLLRIRKARLQISALTPAVAEVQNTRNFTFTEPIRLYYHHVLTFVIRERDVTNCARSLARENPRD